MKHDDPLAAALMALATPPLDAVLAAKVRALAVAELAPSSDVAAAPLRQLVSRTLVPALLASAAVGRTAETVRVGKELFGPTQRDRGRGPRR